MLGRVKNGCRIGARSLGVLGDEPRLLGLPISGVLLALVFLVVIIVIEADVSTRELVMGSTETIGAIWGKARRRTSASGCSSRWLR
jgi:hypothetical protein